MIKKKRCSKCRTEYPATSEYFSPDKRASDGLQSAHNKAQKIYQQTPEGKVVQQKADKKYYQGHREQIQEYNQEYYNTINGYLRHVYNNIKGRIANPVGRHLCYKNIELRFTLDELVDWCVKNNIDPRGLEIHRTKKHYELNNIEFLTSKQHGEKHR